MVNNLYTFFLCVLLLGVVYSTPTIFRKQLAGPASEFDLHVLPSPTVGALSSLSAMIPVDLEAQGSDNEYVWKNELPIDASSNFIFTYASPYAAKTQLSLTGPNGVHIDLAKYASAGTFPIGGETVPVTNYVFSNMTVGRYVLSVKTVGILHDADLQKSLLSASPDCYVVWFNYADTAMYTHLNTYDTEVGEEVGLVTRVYETAPYSHSLGVPNALKGSVQSAQLVVELPDGADVDIKMHDDGLHNDGTADDGVFGGFLKVRRAGQYSAQAVVRGYNSDGVEFIRSTQHLITVVPQFDLTGTAIGTANAAENRIDIALGVFAQDVEATYRGYAEVWGKDATNNDVPICWIASLVNVVDEKKIVLELDLNWVSLANAQAPFTLKNVYVQDINTGVPVATLAQVQVGLTSGVQKLVAQFRKLSVAPTQITEEMRNGVRPPLFALTNITEDSTAGGDLLMIHGYCSGTNPWQAYSKDFTNAKYFLQKSVSVSNDQFAKNVLNWAASFKSYSLVGHSQGGAVSVHLHNYYWSGMDNGLSGRKIQSVGTPYKGCGAAGSAASFGDLFGVGCGRNEDLTRDGAALWIVGITSTTRTKAYFYTTTYKQGQFFGDYCNLAMNLVLAFPNDGTAELNWAKLDGATYLGNTEGWCHTGGMKYAAQYSDSLRNGEMNRLAAR